jgi:dTDP-4-amino-4,6-dideoxygalactose transaminase
MMNPHKITAEFEKALCDYCGSPYAVALYYEFHIKGGYVAKHLGPTVTIPRHTYPSVACEIIHAGGKVEFENNVRFTATFESNSIEGAYQLRPTNVWDSALCFTANMYFSDTHMCLSFTGPYKHLKLGKGGAILTDDEQAYKWFKKARFSGRSECSYHDDNFDDNPVIGWNFYMMPEIAARGLLLMTQFYNQDGTPKHNEDLCLPYPDLSKFKLWQ